MAIRLEDCPPALRAKIEAALALEPKQYFAMATFLQGQWTLGPMTTDRRLIEKLVRNFNMSNPQRALALLRGKPVAVVVETGPSLA